MRPDAGGPAGASGDGPDPEPHRPDGLELAREQARSVAGGPAPTTRRRRPGRGTPPGGQRSDARSLGPAGGRSGGWSGAHPDERDPQPLDTTVGRLVEQHGWALELRVRGVVARWAELVGPEVAAHAQPEGFAEGRLTVRTDSTAWATQLRLLSPTLLARLNTELGAGTVTAIDVQGPVGPSWKRGRRSVRDGRGPRDTYG